MTTKGCRVLVVDDEEAMREVLRARVARWGHEVKVAATVSEAHEVIARVDPHVVVTDLVLPDGTGIDLLHTHRTETRRFVVMTAYGTIDTAVAAMKGGAAEFLTKPVDHRALRALVDGHAATLVPMEDVDEEGALVGQSPAMQAVRKQIAAVAPSMTTVMIVGESGTGKELVARSIHEASGRTGDFVAVNAAAIPSSLAEAELLGYEEGAFTGASKAHPGFFELAEGGTLFLDEITEMPISVQPKLLRAIEERAVRRLGASEEIRCDVRLVVATNRSPEQAVEEELLRVDLFHRVCVFRIDTPPLRTRREDIPGLARRLLQELAERDGMDPPTLTASALQKLNEHEFSGNVRELRNVLERAVIMAKDRIGAAHIVVGSQPHRENPPTDGITLPAKTTAADAERILILETLKRAGNNKAEAARRLGLDVKTIRNKLRSFERNA